MWTNWSTTIRSLGPIRVVKPSNGATERRRAWCGITRAIELLEQGKPVFCSGLVWNGSLDDLAFVAT